MGVTIRFEGELKDEHALADVLAIAKSFSDEHRWPYHPIDQDWVKLSRVREEKDWSYEGPVRGLEIQPHEDSEPLRLEFDRDFYVQDWIKTQFAPVAVHVQLVELLRILRPWFATLSVDDEGEYFGTSDLALLAQYRDSCSEVMNQYLTEPEKYYGPIREGNRIVDLISRD